MLAGGGGASETSGRGRKLPPSVQRALLQCRLQYQFAMFLKAEPTDKELGIHAEIIEMLGRAGVTVAAIEPDVHEKEQHEDQGVVLLLTACTEAVAKSGTTPMTGKAVVGGSSTVLELEYQRLMAERSLQQTHSAKATKSASMAESEMSVSLRLRLAHIIIQRAVDAVTLKMGVVNDSKEEFNAWDVVQEVIPLHDDAWNTLFLTWYVRSSWQHMLDWIPCARSSDASTDLETVRSQRMMSKGDLRKTGSSMRLMRSGLQPETLNGTDWAIEAIRMHMGERVAFFFAYSAFYVMWLIPLALTMVLYYLASRWADWDLYSRGLAFVGYLIPMLWASLFLVFWRQRMNELKLGWGLHKTLERENLNPDAVYELQQEAGGEAVRVYDINGRRRKVALSLVPIVLLNLGLLMVILVPLIQWYILGRMTPLCSCCEWHVKHGIVGAGNGTTFGLPAECRYLLPMIETIAPPTACHRVVHCFLGLATDTGSDAWWYTILQGIVVGLGLSFVQLPLFVAFTAKLVHLENWPTMASLEQSLVQKRQYFCWINMYAWFFLVSFVFVPFGDLMQPGLKNGGLGALVPDYGWLEGHLSLDEAIVVPLLVLQVANVIKETLVPLVSSAIRGCRERRRLAKLQPAGVMAFASSRMLNKVTPVSATEPETVGGSKRVNKSERLDMNALGRRSSEGPTHGSRRIHALQSALKKRDFVAVQVLYRTPDANALSWQDVVSQQTKHEFDSGLDYLHMLMQFGMICMLSVVWPLTPLMVTVATVIEIRVHAVKLLKLLRRPLPNEDMGLQPWLEAFHRFLLLALPIVAAMIVLGTGQLELFTSGCKDAQKATQAMRPIRDCFDSWGWRLLVGVLLERTGVYTVTLLFRLPEMSKATISLKQEEDRREMRELQDALLPTLKPSLQRDLQIVFDYYDTRHVGYLSKSQVLAALKHLNGGKALEKHHNALFMTIVDVDASNTITFAEFVLALQRAEDDIVLGSILDLENLEEVAAKAVDAIPAEKRPPPRDKSGRIMDPSKVQRK